MNRKNDVRKKIVPRPTKASAKRREIALTKKKEKLSLLPDEDLHCIFEHLPASDLLRCACVSKQWSRVSNSNDLWHQVFRQQPKCVRDLSNKAKTCQEINWKNEVILCAKLRRKRIITHLLRPSNLVSVKLQKDNATKTLGVKWLLEFEDNNRGKHRIASEENFIHHLSINVRWNTLDESLPPLTKMKALKLYCLTPLFFDQHKHPIANSTCTPSLIVTYFFKNLPFHKWQYVHADKEISVYVLRELYFGVWNSSQGDIAFIGLTTSLNNLLQRCTQGNLKSTHQPPHQPITDDVDSKYGIHSYTASLDLRNSRKSFFYEPIYTFKEGFWEGEELMLEVWKYEDYKYYGVKEKAQFTWTTATGVRGKIEDFVIMDINLKDSNGEMICVISAPVKIVKSLEDQANYSYENCEVWSLCYKDVDDRFTCSVIIHKNSETDEWSVVNVKFLLKKSSVNNWFATKY